jgi:hypothetical protein
VAGRLVATAPDGRSWPLMEMFTGLLSVSAVDGFKLLGAAAHTPRITVDRLVVAREAWRTTVDGTGLATPTTDEGRYLAARKWRAAQGMPERVFVKLAGEIKPTYVDFASPLYVQSLASMMRAARQDGRGDMAVTVSEMLPGPEHAWVPDAEGRRYLSELRMQITDDALPSAEEDAGVVDDALPSAEEDAGVVDEGHGGV